MLSMRELKTNDAIYRYLDALEKSGRKVVAVDVEAESNLHCYGEHLCLIQIFDLESEVIIDPFELKNFEAIKFFFEKRDILKIMYDSASDGTLLNTVYGIKIQSVLDLRPAVSLLNYQKQNLMYVLSEELGIVPFNKKKFQLYNWMKRPIQEAAIEYALGDVRHLFSLKEKLFDKMRDIGLFDTFILQNLMLQSERTSKKRLPKYEKAKGYQGLDKKQKEMFREIFELRDMFAKKVNKPPDYVFSNVKLLALCQHGLADPALLKEGIHPKIDRPLQEEILVRFSQIVHCRLGSPGGG